MAHLRPAPGERRGLQVREKRTQIDVGPKTASDPELTKPRSKSRSAAIFISYLSVLWYR
jgi:hypothetical protein